MLHAGLVEKAKALAENEDLAADDRSTLEYRHVTCPLSTYVSLVRSAGELVPSPQVTTVCWHAHAVQGLYGNCRQTGPAARAHLTKGHHDLSAS